MLSKQKNSLWGVFLCLFSPFRAKLGIYMSQHICYIRVVMINKGDVMNSISKTILLSAVSLFVDNGNLTYASEKIPLSVPKSGIHTLHTHHTYIRHTLQGLDLSSRLFDDSKISGKEQKVASVCFITDAGNCSGDRFGNTETPGGGNGGGTPNGNDPDYDTIPEQCRDAGYTKTSCPTGQHLVNPCPSDNRYYERCECDNDYSELCNGTDQKGVGKACDGKYKECCNLCSDYPYSSVPAGYVSIGECDSCDGKRYQIKCDNKTYLINSNICGVYGGYGNSCTDDGGTYFRECKCPLNYEWSATALKCVCSSAFKYTCTGTGYARGDGEPCDGKYKACICAEGYSWDAATGKCLLSCANECSLTTCPSPFTCRYEECSKRYCKTGCEAGYDWDASTQTCNSQCSASYKYDESNCPTSSNYHCSFSTCNGKYTDCNALLYTNGTKKFSIDGYMFARTSDLCPNGNMFTTESIHNGGNIESYLYECKDRFVDDACYNLYRQLSEASAGSTVNVTQNMSCGNLSLIANNNNVTLNGNGKTLTFEHFVGDDFTANYYYGLNVTNLNIISTTRLTAENEKYFDTCGKQSTYHPVFSSAILNNVNVTSPYLGHVRVYGNFTYTRSYGYHGGSVPYNEIEAQPSSVINLKGADSTKVTLLDNANLNIKSSKQVYATIAGENTTINLCNYNDAAYAINWKDYICRNVTVNSNKAINITWASSSRNEKCLSYVTVNLDSRVCSSMNF